MIEPIAEVAVEPYVLNTTDAAVYVGLAGRTLKNIRADDRERMAVGVPIQGPRWIVVGTSVFYRVRDLKEWIETRATEQGTALKGRYRDRAPQGPGSAHTEPQD